MTQDKVHRIYKQIAYTLGGVSLLLLILPFADYNFSDRIGLALMINLGFHLFYYGLSFGPLSQLGWLKDNTITKDLARRGYTAMSYFIIASSLFMTITVISDVISTQEFYELTTLFVCAGVFLGALKLNLELRGKK